jgi:malonate-semialdehyde dehydrogenase (acetylating)/methylmalonate-semialdehyde dehydrogenase
VSFVGSTPIAKYIYETGTKNGKRVQALGGAKNHMLVLPDADLDMAADAAVSAAYGSAGERCMAISVVLGDGLRRRRARRQDPGPHPRHQGRPGVRADNEMGPLITGEHRDKVRGYVGRARRRAPPSSSTAPPTRPGERVLPEAEPHRQRQARHEGLRRRDLRAGAVVAASASYGRGLGAINDNPYRQRHGHLHAATTRRRPAIPVRVNVGMGGRQTSHTPFPSPTIVRRVEASLVRRTRTWYGPEGVNFYTRTKVVTLARPDPSSSSIDPSGVPQTGSAWTSEWVLQTYPAGVRVVDLG